MVEDVKAKEYTHFFKYGRNNCCLYADRNDLVERNLMMQKREGKIVQYASRGTYFIWEHRQLSCSIKERWALWAQRVDMQMWLWKAVEVLF